MSRILIIDDAFSVRAAVQHIIEQIGHEVIGFEDAREALQFARKESVDLVITDLNMPVMNGTALIGCLRNLDNYAHTPILVLTAETATEKREKTQSAGATGWISKPFTPERIKSAIQKAID